MMKSESPLIVPLDRLEWDEPNSARFDPAGEALVPETASAMLMQVVRSAASAAADGAEVFPVSVTLDVAGTLSGVSGFQFSAAIDRRTRTIVFANGSAKQDGQTVLTATAVYRIAA